MSADRERQLILDAKERGGLATLLTYTRLSAQAGCKGAITLGGGSLAGALYLGVSWGMK